jgi:protein-S-isoprenylcysteine O-methyltransferase Ste14
VNIDLLIYAAHGLLWLAFGLGRLAIRRRSSAAAVPGQPEVATAASTAPYSRLLLVVHSLAFFIMYYGLGAAVIPARVPHVFTGQRVSGALVIGVAAALICWALVHFDSWRVRAKLDVGHRLATDGPFRYLRHPIYMGLNLLAIGSAIWVPTPALWASALLMCIGSDLRARAEEKLLTRAFGAAYSDYCKRTSRFVPGLY